MKKPLFKRCEYFLAFLWVFLLVCRFSFTGFTQNTQKVDSLKNELEIALEKSDTANLYKICYKLAEAFIQSGKYIHAEEHIDKAFVYATPLQKLQLLNLKGTIKWYRGNYEQAMRVFRQELKQAEQLGDKKFQAMAMSNIGFIYAEYDNHAKTLDYYKKALKIRKNNGDLKGVALSYLKIGQVYAKMDSMQKSLDNYNKSYAMFNQVTMPVGKSNVLNNLGNAYLKLKQYLKAEDYYKQSLKIRKEINHSYLIAESHKNLARVYIAQKEYALAEKSLYKGIDISIRNNAKKALRDFYLLMYKLNNQKGQYQAALNYYLKYAQLNDSLLSKESKNKIAELEIQYQTEKKDQEIRFLKIRDDLNLEVIQKQEKTLVILLIGIFLTVGLLSLILYIHFQRNRAYKMLVKQNIVIANLERDETKNDVKKEISNEQNIVDDLLLLVEKEKYYLNTNCNIDELAKKIDTNRQYLSKVINSHFNTNFTNFINSYRVKESRKLLLDNKYDKYTMEAIGKLSGFNNRVTFYAAFKKVTGVTPSFFKKQQDNII